MGGAGQLYIWGRGSNTKALSKRIIRNGGRGWRDEVLAPRGPGLSVWDMVGVLTREEVGWYNSGALNSAGQPLNGVFQLMHTSGTVFRSEAIRKQILQCFLLNGIILGVSWLWGLLFPNDAL